MRKILLTGIVLTISALFFGACEIPSSTANRGTDSEMTDGRLKDLVQARLNADPQLKQAGIDVSADASKNQVNLSGTVESEALRSKAVELAKDAKPGLAVFDKIDVVPHEATRSSYSDEQAKTERERAKGTGDKLGDTMDDAWIHMKIVSKLVGNTQTPARKINVDVVDQVVTLRGTVDTANEKAEAERVAKDTDGVKSVQNLLKVGKGA